MSGDQQWPLLALMLGLLPGFTGSPGGAPTAVLPSNRTVTFEVSGK